MTSKMLFEASILAMPKLARELDGASILVTGASGFLASNLLAYLIELKRIHGIELNLAASARRPACEVPLFAFLKIAPPPDWQIASVENTLIPEDKKWIVIHTASFGSPSDYMREPIATFEANAYGLNSLFYQATESNCERLIYYSSAEVYGQPPDACIPTNENYRGAPDLSDPRSIYGESKRMAEVLGLTLSREKKIPFAVIRPWNIYGPGQRLHDGRVPVEFFRQIEQYGKISLLSDGSPKRSFCHVWEAIPQIISCFRCLDSNGAAFNIGKQGDETTILELAHYCASTAGLSSDVVEYNKNNKSQGMQRCEPDTFKVRNLQSDAFSIPLEIGLHTCHEWIKHLTQIR